MDNGMDDGGGHEADPPENLDPFAPAGSGRRRGLTNLAAVVVTAGVVLTASLTAEPHSQPAPRPAAQGVTAAPEGMRLVGVGRAAVAVPSDWGTNRIQCAVPIADTVITATAFAACALSVEPEVDSVAVRAGRPLDFTLESTATVDGERVERTRTTCRPRSGFAARPVCTGTSYVPSQDATFVAQSPSADGVETILRRVRMVFGLVGVPAVTMQEPSTAGRPDQQYSGVLDRLGLRKNAQQVTSPGMPTGLVLDVAPAPGTMVPTGSAVDMTVVAPPRGPADEVTVGTNSFSHSKDTWVQEQSDAQVRSGGTVRLEVGDWFWAYASGKRAGTLRAEVDGDVLEVLPDRTAPNYPNTWRVVAPGRTTVTLVLTASGERVVLGSVTVVAS